MSTFDATEHPIIGIGGPVRTYELPDVSLVFDGGQGRFHIDGLDKIEVAVHDDDQRLRFPFSLMGADVLSRFRIDYDDLIYLEK